MGAEMRNLTRDFTIPAALPLLPAKMDSPEARAMLLAIAGQETDFRHRVQVVGPAIGLWQFERPTVALVLNHAVIGAMAKAACEALLYAPEAALVHAAMADNDVLACVFARLLLWPDPHQLPGKSEQYEGWRYYLRCWRPGKPHVATWGDNWRLAWRS